MDRINWNKLKTFYKVASAGSFSKAAERYHMDVTALSKMVKSFENELGFKVLLRRPEGLQLTNEGEILFTEANKFANILEIVEDDLKNKDMKGSLKLVSPTGISSMYLSKFISKFSHNFPQINLEIISFDTLSLKEMLSGHILIHPYIDELKGYNQDPLITTELKMYASQKYLDKNGVPKSIEDLNHHRLIAFSQNKLTYVDFNWHLKIGMPVGKKRIAVFEADASFGRCFIAHENVGIISVPKQHPDIKKYKLIEVLPEIEGPSCSYHLIVDEILNQNHKVKVLSKFLRDEFLQL